MASSMGRSDLCKQFNLELAKLLNGIVGLCDEHKDHEIARQHGRFKAMLLADPTCSTPLLVMGPFLLDNSELIKTGGVQAMYDKRDEVIGKLSEDETPDDTSLIPRICEIWSVEAGKKDKKLIARAIKQLLRFYVKHKLLE